MSDDGLPSLRVATLYIYLAIVHIVSILVIYFMLLSP